MNQVAKAIAVVRNAESEFNSLGVRLSKLNVTDPERAENGRTLLSAVQFCAQSCALAVLALERGYFLHEHTLARPVLELSLRMLYASRLPDGWTRFRKHWAKRNKKWAEASKLHYPESEKFWRDWLAESTREYEALHGSDEMPVQLGDVLRDLVAVELEAGDGWVTKPEECAVLEHMVFKAVNSATHGDPFYLDRNRLADDGIQEFPLRGGADFLVSVLFMLRAVYTYAGWSGREEDAKVIVSRLEALSHHRTDDASTGPPSAPGT